MSRCGPATRKNSLILKTRRIGSASLFSPLVGLGMPVRVARVVYPAVGGTVLGLHMARASAQADHRRTVARTPVDAEPAAAAANLLLVGGQLKRQGRLEEVAAPLGQGSQHQEPRHEIHMRTTGPERLPR